MRPEESVIISTAWTLSKVPRVALIYSPDVQTGSTTHPRLQGTDQDAIVRLGGWLFKQRSWLPVPIVVALLVIPAAGRPPLAVWGGVVLAGLGELLRLWAVHHIGVISRTRSERLGPLISTGPFGFVRNPLYLGNIALWLGFTVSAGLLWLVPVVLLLLAVEYHAIVRWEEGLLASRMGAPYQQYLRDVPRWVPMLTPVSIDPGAAPGAASASAAGSPDSPPAAGLSGHATRDSSRHSWRDTLLSERSTLIAVVLGYALLWLKG